MKSGQMPAALIVEKDPQLRFLLAELCALSHCDVVGEVEDLCAANEALRSYRPDIIISGCSLTYEWDGLDAIASARAIWPMVTSILLTVRNPDSLGTFADGAAPDHVLQKPFSPFALIEILNSAADTSSQVPRSFPLPQAA